MQPDATDAHHIVARTRHLARVARTYLFRWKIGIGDADNGVFLPKKLGANVAGLEKAVPHGPLHSGPYHFEVADWLRERSGEPASAAREELRQMRADMIDGSFPYMRT